MNLEKLLTQFTLVSGDSFYIDLSVLAIHWSTICCDLWTCMHTTFQCVRTLFVSRQTLESVQISECHCTRQWKRRQWRFANSEGLLTKITSTTFVTMFSMQFFSQMEDEKKKRNKHRNGTYPFRFSLDHVCMSFY